MFGIGGFELFIILIFGFLIFGPDKLPEIAKTVGKGIARFREAQAEMNDTLGGEKIFDPNNPDQPFKDPVEVLDRIAQKQEDKKAGKVPAGTAAPAPELAASVPAAASEQTGEPKQESFTERKARYERERAARKAAEAEAQAAAADASAGDDTAATPAATPAVTPAEGGDA